MKIYYFQDASGGYEKFSPYLETIRKLKDRGKEAHGLHLEKLRTHRKPGIYSIRVNDTHRILMTIYQGRYYLLDIVLNHDYAKNRFLRDNLLLKAVLSSSDDVEVDISSEAADFVWEEVSKDDFASLPVDDGSIDSIKALEYQHRRFIELSVHQETALHTSLPAIVSGPAGSGKSSVALSMLARYLREHQDDATAFPVLYVSQSPYLVDEIIRAWQEMVPDALLSARVAFKTYDQMLAEALDIDEAQFVGEKYFLSWYSGFVSKGKWDLPDGKVVWQECRIRSGYTSDEAYFELGHRQSGVDRADRGFVCRAYHAFLAKVAESGYRSPVLDDLRAGFGVPYRLFIVDEAQDFSYGQLHRLNQLSGGSIVFFLGDHQILYDGKSRLNYLKSLFHGHAPAKVTVLDATYRCSEQVSALANALIDIKYRITGGASDKLSTTIKGAEDALLGKGIVRRFQRDNIPQIDLLAHQARSSRYCAVVTLSQYLEEARRIFGAMVFTPVQVKGLEFDTVILWRLLDSDEAREASGILSFSKSPSRHRAKAGSGNESYESYCNSLITSVTRARNQVVMFENNEHFISPFLSLLDKALHKAHASSEILSPKIPSSTADWVKTALELYSRGIKEQALHIFIENLGGTQDTFDSFIAAHRKKAAATVSDGAVAAPDDVCVEKVCSVMIGVSASPGMGSYVDELRFRDVLSNPDSKQRSAVLPDLLKKENLLLLRRMSGDLFNSIPPEVWIMWLGKKKNATPLLLHLVADAENGLFVFQRILANKAVVIPDSIWNYSASSEHKLFSGTTIPYWLLRHAEGQIIFYQLLSTFKKEMVKTIITDTFLITAPPGHEGFSPLAMMIATEQGLELLKILVTRFPNIIKKIPCAVWSSPHPIIKAEEDDLPLSIIDSIQARSNGLELLKLLKPHLHLTKILGPSLLDFLWNAATIKTFYGLGFDVNRSDEDGNTLVILAIKAGKVNVLRALHECHVDLNQAIIGEMTPLYYAVTLGHVAVIEALGLLGVDFNRESKDGKTPAFIAAELGEVEVLRALHRFGALLNKPTRTELTPLFTAVSHGDAAIVRELSRLGVNLDQETSEGLTSVHLAVQYGKIEVLRALYECHADFNKVSKSGITPVHAAAKLGDVAVLRVLYECNVNLNTAMENGVTPAYIAVSEGHLEALQELYKLCPEINTENLVSIVLQTDHADIMQFLMDMGTDFYSPYIFSAADLISFCEGKCAEMALKVTEKISALLAEGQDVSNLLLLPMDIALLFGYEKIIKLLQAQKSFIENDFYEGTEEVDKTAGASIELPKPLVATQLSQFGLLKMDQGSKATDYPDPLESSVSLELFH